jgi:hypothetical protein
MRVKRASEAGTNKPDFVGFTEAGIVGCKMGVNAVGIGLCVNGLVTNRDGVNGFRKPSICDAARSWMPGPSTKLCY